MAALTFPALAQQDRDRDRDTQWWQTEEETYYESRPGQETFRQREERRRIEEQRARTERPQRQRMYDDQDFDVEYRSRTRVTEPDRYDPYTDDAWRGLYGHEPHGRGIPGDPARTGMSDWVRVAVDYDGDGRYDAVHYVSADRLSMALGGADRDRSGTTSGTYDLYTRDRTGVYGDERRTDPRFDRDEFRTQRQFDDRLYGTGEFDDFGRDTRQTMRTQYVSGEIVRTSTQTVADRRHVIATVEQEDGRTIRVDLGPEDNLRRLNLREGSVVSITTQRTTAADRGVVRATRVESQGQTVTIQARPGMEDRDFDTRGRTWTEPRDQGMQDMRDPYRTGDRTMRSDRYQGAEWRTDQPPAGAERLSGQVSNKRTVSIQGADQRFVIADIRSRDGETKTVVLGPEDQLNRHNIEDDSQITLLGERVTIDGREAVKATQLRVDGRNIEIRDTLYQTSIRTERGGAWGRMDRQSGTSGMDRAGASGRAEHIAGSVTSTRTVSFEDADQRYMIADIESHDGRTHTVVLGPENTLRRHNISEDSQISLTGERITIDGRDGFKATQLRVDGETVEVRDTLNRTSLRTQSGGR